VVIQCGEDAPGSEEIISYGNYNINGGNITNCGNITANDACILATSTTQIQTGTSAINMTIGGTTRVTADNTGTKLYTRFAQAGPSGAFLYLNDNSTLSLGTYNSENGAIECTPNLLQLVGPEAKSSIDFTSTTITTGLAVGLSGRIPREILDTTNHIFAGPAGIEKLRVSDSGVTVNNTYTLATTAGTNGQVLTTDGAGSTSWQNVTTSVLVSPDFSSVLECKDAGFIIGEVNAVERLNIDGTGSTILKSGNGNDNRIDLFNNTIGAYINNNPILYSQSPETQLKSPDGSNYISATDAVGIGISGLYTLPTTAGTAGQVLTRSGVAETTWQTPAALNPFDQTLNTTDNVAFSSATTTSVDFAGAISLGTSLATSVTVSRPATQVLIDGLSCLIKGGSPAMYMEVTPTDITLLAGNPTLTLLTTIYMTPNRLQIAGPGSQVYLEASSTGVEIGGNYALPTTLGTAGQVLTRSGVRATDWQTPVALNPFDQTLNTADNVNFNSVTTNSVDNIAPLLLGGVLASSVTLGNVAAPILANGSAFTLTTPTTQIANSTSQIRMTADNVGATSTTAVDIQPTTYTVSQKSGGIEYSRHEIIGVNQILRDQLGVERLRVSNSGVRISSAYTLTGVVGPAGGVLTSNGAGATSWEIPIVVNPFDQDLNTGDSVTFSSVTTTSLDSTGVLLIGLSPGGSRIFGNATTSATIQGSTISLNGPVNVNGDYTFPVTPGTTGQVITKTGPSSSAWQTPQVYGLRSQTGTAVVVNTTVETTLIAAAGTGSMTVPANFFSTPGISLRYATGGIFRDAANNTTIRFRWKTGATVLFDSANLALTNINALVAWNIDIAFTYVGGATGVVTNFTLCYSAGSVTRGFTVQGTSNLLNTAVANTFDLTAQWPVVASVNNTITSNYGVFSKMY
jgi:hypothetical protein